VLLVAVVAGMVAWHNLTGRDEDTSPVDTATAPPPAAVTPATVPAARTDDRLLAVLGLLSAAQLHQTFLNIGLLADGVETETYSKAQAEKTLGTVLGLLDLMDQQLGRLRDSDLGPDDMQAVERIRDLSDSLRDQASALRTYWKSGAEADALLYEEAREEAWAGLSELLENQGPAAGAVQ
jgi:hypothetical protein